MKTRIGLTFILFALTLGCTRQSVQETSTLSFSLEGLRTARSVKAMSSQLAHIVVNVSGPGIAAPIILNWDFDRPDPSCTTEACHLVVPAGKQRLVQLLGVYKESETDTMSFYYGDAVKDLINADESVAISITSVNTNVNARDVEIKGRFLSTPDRGPTGNLDLKFNPGIGKPSLLIESSEIFNGWFRSFGLVGINFEYVFNGIIMGGSSKPINELFNPADPSQLIIEWPEYYYKYDDRSTIVNKSRARTEFIGFFGPYASSGRVCFNGTASDIMGAYLDATGTTKLSYNPTNISTGNVYVNRSAANTCEGSTTPDNPITSFGLYIDPAQHSFDFTGPFMRRPMGNFVSMTGGGLANPEVTFTWSFLPGAQVDLTGVKVYGIRDGNIDLYRGDSHGDSYDCFRLSGLAGTDPNVVLLGSSNSNSLTVNSVSFGLNQSSAPIVCAYNDARMFAAGAGSQNYSGPTGGTGPTGDTDSTGGTGPCINCSGPQNGLPAKIVLESSSEPNAYVAAGACFRIAATLKDSNDYHTSANTDLHFVVNANGTPISLYHQDDWNSCNSNMSGNAASDPHFTTGQNRIEFLVKNIFTEGTSFTLTPVATGLTAISTTVTTALSTYSFIQSDLSWSLLAGFCYEVNLTQRSISQWIDVAPAQQRLVSFAGTSSNITVYESFASCSANSPSITSATLASGLASTTVYLKLTSSLADMYGAQFITQIPADTNVVSNSKVISIGYGSSTPVQMNVSGGYDLYLNQCTNLNVELRNENGTVVVSSATGISGISPVFSDMTGAFYSNQSNCSAGSFAMNSPMSLPGNKNRYEIWFKPTQVTSGSNMDSTLGFTASNPAIAMSTNTFDHYRFRVRTLPEVNDFSMHAYPYFTEGICNKVDIELQNYSNNNGNVVNSNNITIGSFYFDGISAQYFTNEPDCNSNVNITSSINIPAGSLRTVMFMKYSGASGNHNFSASSTAMGGFIGRSFNVNTGSMGSIQALNFANFSNYEKFRDNECREYDLYFTDSSGLPSNRDGSGSSATSKVINLSLRNLDDTADATATSMSFYANCGSTTAITSTTVAGADVRTHFALKANGIPGVGFKMKASSSIPNSGPTVMVSRIVNPSPIAHHLKLKNIFGGGPITAGSTCMTFQMEAQDNTNVPMIVPSPIPLAFELYAQSKGQFSTSGCGFPSGFIEHIHAEVLSGSNYRLLYFVPTTAGTFTTADFNMWGFDLVNSDAANFVDSAGFPFIVTAGTGPSGSPTPTPTPTGTAIPSANHNMTTPTLAPHITYVGMHDTAVRTINFTHDADSVECSHNGGSTYAPCDSGNSLIFTTADYSSSALLKIKYVKAGAPDVFDTFTPATSLPGLVFLPCSNLISVNQTNSEFEAIITSGTASNSRHTICVDSGITINALAATPVTINTMHMDIVGTVAGTPTMFYVQQTEPATGSPSKFDFNRYINLNFRGDSTSANYVFNVNGVVSPRFFQCDLLSVGGFGAIYSSNTLYPDDPIIRVENSHVQANAGYAISINHSGWQMAKLEVISSSVSSWSTSLGSDAIYMQGNSAGSILIDQSSVSAVGDFNTAIHVGRALNLNINYSTISAKGYYVIDSLNDSVTTATYSINNSSLTNEKLGAIIRIKKNTNATFTNSLLRKGNDVGAANYWLFQTHAQTGDDNNQYINGGGNMVCRLGTATFDNLLYLGSATGDASSWPMAFPGDINICP
jgi:hypothetical protein